MTVTSIIGTVVLVSSVLGAGGIFLRLFLHERREKRAIEEEYRKREEAKAQEGGDDDGSGICGGGSRGV